MTTTPEWMTPLPEYDADHLPPHMIPPPDLSDTPEPEQEHEPVTDDPPMRVDLLVINLDGRAHVHVMFDKRRPIGANTRNISLDGDEFDYLITPSVAADIAHRLRKAQPDIAGLLERLERHSRDR